MTSQASTDMAGFTDTLESLHHVRVFVSAGLGRQDSLMQSPRTGGQCQQLSWEGSAPSWWEWKRAELT